MEADKNRLGKSLFKVLLARKLVIQSFYYQLDTLAFKRQGKWVHFLLIKLGASLKRGS